MLLYIAMDNHYTLMHALGVNHSGWRRERGCHMIFVNASIDVLSLPSNQNQLIHMIVEIEFTLNMRPTTIIYIKYTNIIIPKCHEPHKPLQVILTLYVYIYSV